jgi:hypothetical protein
MSRQTIADNSSLTVWQTETLRLTAFPSPSARIVNPTWWADIVGEPPESKISRPKEGIYQEEGPFAQGKLVVSVQPTRVDWLFTSIIDPKREDMNVPIIGTFSEALDRFFSLMLRWFEFDTCPPVQRLAFGAILLQSVEDRQDGYRRIAEYLPSIRLDPDGSSDFAYQINRPRNSTSGITGLRINRLSKWSVASWRSTQISLGSAAPMGYFLGPEYFACRLELDINTSQDFQGELPREQLPRIFQELADLGKEIAIKGDIP